MGLKEDINASFAIVYNDDGTIDVTYTPTGAILNYSLPVSTPKQKKDACDYIYNYLVASGANLS